MAEPRLVTPEAVPLDLRTASVASRFFALAIDWLIQFALLFGGLFAGGVVVAATGDDQGLAIAFVFLWLFLVLFGYPVACEVLLRGRTPGKMALGLRVVTKEGAPVRFRHAAVRAVLGLVDFLLTFGLGALLCALLTRDDQRLGDLVAGTLVLRERTGQRAPVAVTFPLPAGLEGYAATLDVSGLSPDDYAAVRAFLMRAPTLPPAVRSSLAVALADPLVSRLRTTPPPGMPAETFLLTVAAVHQRRAAGAAGPVGAPPVWSPPAAAPPLPSAAPPPAPDPAPGGFAPPT